MKKNFIIVLGMLLAMPFSYSQTAVFSAVENFDGNSVSFNSTPAGTWSTNTNYAVSSPNSYRGRVGAYAGDTVVLETSSDYDLTSYAYVQLRFWHICKVSPRDKVSIEYRLDGTNAWIPIPYYAYLGNAANYRTTGFNASSYAQWQGNDSLAQPSDSWWREEVFDIGSDVNHSRVRFRFVVVHGSTSGTQISYGWLLDNFEIRASNYEIKEPAVAFSGSYPHDTVYSTGPYEINAKVAARTAAPIEQPWLKYTTSFNGAVVKTDSILMTNIAGDSLWKAAIPQFIPGTKVSYSITGRDTTGNYAMISSWYVVKQPTATPNGYRYAGDTNSTDDMGYSPYSPWDNYSWSRSLVLASEIDPAMQGGVINSIAYFPITYNATSTMYNQSLYFKVVSDISISSDLWIEPLADGATLVWQGSIPSPPINQWMDIPLTTSFFLPPNSNLLVYWLNNNGTEDDEARWKSTYFPVNMSAEHQGSEFPTDDGSLTGSRPNMRFNVLSTINYSAAVIDIADTVFISFNSQVPIVYTVKNKGMQNLDSALVTYSINGSAPVSSMRYFNPALSWDFNFRDTIAYYTAQINQYDTISIKVELPNGEYDINTLDNELTKAVYVSSDIQMKFVNPVTDIIYETLPVEIVAQIVFHSGTAIENVSLYVQVTQPGNTKYDTIPMLLDPSDKLFKAIIPVLPHEGDVAYHISLTDIAGNLLTIANSFQVKYLGTPAYITIGDQSSTPEWYGNPYGQNYHYSWSKNIYLASELHATFSDVAITHLAWSVQSAGHMIRSPQSCYLQAVQDTEITEVTDGWNNPAVIGATLVWRGSLMADSGWNEIEFNKPFVLPQGQNLMVYWIDSTGVSIPQEIVFYTTSTSNEMSVCDYGNWEFPMYSDPDRGSTYNFRPDIRFYIYTQEADSSAVALNSILVPPYVNTGTPVEVKAVIKNTGLKELESCRIYWTLNGVQQPPLPYYLYNGNPLARGATDTVVIGSYTAVPGQTDAIKVWVSTPNGGIDTVVHDDTLQIAATGCGAPFTGNILIGNSSSAQFSSISEALYMIAYCGMSGKTVLKVENGSYPESIDFTVLNGLLSNTDTLELHSLSGNASDVIVESPQCVVTLGSSNNIILKNMTFNLIGQGFGIYFTDSCNNVEITGCSINLDTTLAKGITRPNMHIGVFKDDESKSAHNIRIVNNIITGGYYAVSLSGGSSTGYGTDWVFDGNTIQNAYWRSVFMNCTDFQSIFNNTVISMADANYVNNEWYGFFISNCNVEIIANNRIDGLRHPNLEIPHAMYFSSLNSDTTPAKIYNNEILVSKAGTAASNVFTFNFSSSADIYHNSIYVGGSSQAICYAMYIDTERPVNIRNNNIVTTNYRPVYYISDTSTNSDYNNFYTGGTVFGNYRGTDVNNLASWQAISGKDYNSVSVLPLFMDINTNLKIYDSRTVPCPAIADVPQDINGNPRTATTAMGAYTVIQFPTPEATIKLYNWTEEDIVNQIKPIKVTITNFSSLPLQTAVLEWTLNGGTPVSYTWNAPAALPFLGEAVITIGNFPVSNINDVKIWITALNGSNTFVLPDTVYAYSEMKPLAELVNPLVEDTIYSLTFDIHSLIRSFTGAPTVSPRMHLQSIVNNAVVFHDTIDMLLEDSIWVSRVPKQYYNSKIIYSFTVSDTIDNSLTIIDSTYIQYKQGSELYPTNNLSIVSIEKPVADNVLCSGDYAPVRVTIANTGMQDYDFSVNPITLTLEVSNPISFFKDTVLTSDSLLSGESMTIELTDALPIIISGEYNIKTWLNNPLDSIIYDDTLSLDYVSGKFALPIDENFNSPGLPLVFRSEGNTGNTWKVISQGTGADTAVNPQEGTGMLAFSGTPGSISTLFTHQLDLSRAIQPRLSFWYFHDTLPCDDYTNVRITIDGGATYRTILALTKEGTVYGWKEYNVDLPAFAINQCVILAFDAMESLSGNVTQYIDHILITAKQEIAITDIFTSELSVCSLDNKEWKVVLSNSTAPDLDYSKTPVEITLELAGTSHTFVETISSGILEGFSSDTITIASGFNFAPGQYIAKANISSIFGEVFIDTIDINPKFKIEIAKLSVNNPALAGFEHFQKATIKNTGNMELSDIGLILTITSDDGVYIFNVKDTFSQNLQPNATADFTFDSAYIVPWSRNYDVKVHGYLICDSMVFNANFYAQEEVDINDLYIVDISSPQNNTVDTVNSLLNVSVNVKNRSLGTSPYNNVEISLLLTDTNGNPIADPVSEYIPSVAGGMEYPFTFSESYRVPEMTKYYLTVFIEQKDNYTDNDTLTIVRETTSDVNVLERVGASFTMKQNIPNPAKGNTLINYSIPQDGEIIFQIHSVSGQILYNKVENVPLGEHQIELNLSDYASGIYFYSMEYKGHRIVKRMSVK